MPCRRFLVSGRVQGVAYRAFTRMHADALGLSGWADNLRDGRVEVVAEGPKKDCERLLELLRGGTTPGHVDLVVERWSAPKDNVTGFSER